MEKSELEQKFLSLVDSYKQVIYKSLLHVCHR